MIEEVLDPGVVGVAGRRNAVLPASVCAQQLTGPIAVVKGGIGDYVIGFQVLMAVVQKRAFVIPEHLRTVNTPDRQIHPGQTPGGLVAFLPVNGNVVYPSLMVGHKLFRLHKHAAGAAAGVEHAAFVGFQHLHQQFTTLRGV